MGDDAADNNAKYLAYLNKHAARMKMWAQTHPQWERPPVWEDDKGNVHWANRAERRKAEKRK